MPMTLTTSPMKWAIKLQSNRTFSGNGGSCSDGNRNGSNPPMSRASGVMVQAYAGICKGDKRNPTARLFPPRQSQRNTRVHHQRGYQYASCGTLTSTGNTAPTFTTASAFTIQEVNTIRSHRQGGRSGRRHADLSLGAVQSLEPGSQRCRRADRQRWPDLPKLHPDDITNTHLPQPALHP